MQRVIIVVPCYNEARRLTSGAFLEFLRRFPDVHFLFVDDGSSDDTIAVLRSVRAASDGQADVLRLARNGGKAEAVRHGMLAAIRQRPAFVGFWDADLATPLDAIPLFLDEFERHPTTEMVLGSRVQLLGRAIERQPRRHYAGRGFATIVSLLLRLAVYDTQCGAKLFRCTPTLEAILRDPFLSRWVFDVEILARLEVERRRSGSACVAACVRELPLPAWRDIAGSKLVATDVVRVAADLWRIHRWLRNARSAANAAERRAAVPAASGMRAG